MGFSNLGNYSQESWICIYKKKKKERKKENPTEIPQ